MNRDDNDGLRYLADTINGIVWNTFWFRIGVFVAYLAFLYLAISGKLERFFS